jgi:hypothetical protein
MPTAGTIFPAAANQSTQSIAPFGNQATADETANSNTAPRLHFAQALDALEIEIFAKKHTCDDITERLKLLEKAVFGDAALPELSDNMARLIRLVNSIHVSDKTIESVTQTAPSLARQSTQSFGEHHRDILSKTLHSPSFWLLIGATGAIIGAYFLSKSTKDSQESRYINPDQGYVGPYLRNGQWVSGGMRTMPNGITSDNLSGR